MLDEQNRASLSPRRLAARSITMQHHQHMDAREARAVFFLARSLTRFRPA